jgi:glutathione S-transferase
MKPLHPFPLKTLASHPLCPFLQRVVLTGLVKGYARGQDFAPRYHALGEAPEWLLALSPQRRDPVFELDAGGVLFDARVAAALVDEASGPTLASDDVFARARERELVAHAQVVLEALRGVFTAADGAAVQLGERRLFDALAVVEPHLRGGARYGGSRWSQVDCAYAPAFSLMLFFRRLRDTSSWRPLPNLARWASALADDPLAQASRCDGYREEFERFFAFTGSRFPDFAEKTE